MAEVYKNTKSGIVRSEKAQHPRCTGITPDTQVLPNGISIQMPMCRGHVARVGFKLRSVFAMAFKCLA